MTHATIARIAFVISELALLAACGIISAPASVPQAIARNADYNFKGPVLDTSGKRLDAVVMSQTLHHYFWTPVAGGKMTDEHILRRVDNAYSIEERGADLSLVFSREGYVDMTVTTDAQTPHLVHIGYGRHMQVATWAASDSLPVVMISNTPGIALIGGPDTLELNHYPQTWGVKLDMIGQRPREFISLNSEHPEPFAGPVLYATMANGTSKPMNAGGDIDRLGASVPESVTLHIGGDAPGSGFFKIDPRPGFSPMLTADAAPPAELVGAYDPALALSHQRLKEMRTSPNATLTQRCEFFFFYSGGHYGKGALTWYTPSDPGSLVFRILLFMNPTSGSRDLTFHNFDWQF